MNPLIQLKTTPPLLITLALLCFGLLPRGQAVSPPPDGGYFGANTAEGGAGALFSLTTGSNNTAIGSQALFSLTTGKQNTATGAQALKDNTGDENTADGFQALNKNTEGFDNTASGWRALFQNTTGGGNTATGFGALYSNTEGFDNTATGNAALSDLTTGSANTAMGRDALFSLTNGLGNTAMGTGALGSLTVGFSDTALGLGAGSNVTAASNVICIGTAGVNVDNSCFIGNIFGATSSGGVAVFINSNGQLGTMTSSARYKDEIKPIGKASEALFALKPVAFRYKKDIDPAGTPQLGLVAEEVEKVNPDLVVRDKEGKPYSVRYEQVNAMLLNEFLKEHRTMQEQGGTIAELKKQVTTLAATVKEQAAQIQKVSAQLEASKPAPQVVNNP